MDSLINKNIYAVILAGGVGSRFWPLSRELEPKQFLCINGNRSLLQRTIERILPVVSEKNIYIIGNNQHKFELKKQTSLFSVPEENIIFEPKGKNTAPAIGLAAKFIARLSPDHTMIVLAADHYISETDKFIQVLRQAEKVAQQNYLVTLGIKPHMPHTGYGYIKIKPQAAGCKLQEGAYLVEKFVEKPNKQLAAQYVEDSHYFWNSGIFLWKAKVILDEIQTCLPELARNLKEIDSFQQIDEQIWGKITPISIDYGVLEKSKHTAVVIARDIGWTDLGSWAALSDIMRKDEKGNVFEADSIDIDSENISVFGNTRLIATVGLKNVIVSDTQDALLVCDRAKAEKVKDVVRILNKKGRPEHSIHRTVRRPWGSYTVLNEGRGFKVKIVEILPYKRLSLQKHKNRSEHWVVVEGLAKITNADKSYLLDENESAYIPKRGIHRLENPIDRPLKIIEVQCGQYTDEDDI